MHSPSQCLGYVYSPNLTYNYKTPEGASSIRIQSVPCLTGAETDFTKEKLAQQVWSGELNEFTPGMISLRNVCTQKVIKKVQPDHPHGCDDDPTF